MERGSAKHGPRLDEQMEHETLSMVQGAPVESRAEEAFEKEGAADDEPVPDSRLSGDRGEPVAGLAYDEIEARSDLARHLEPSVFPAEPLALVASARRTNAPDQMVERLSQLPAGRYESMAAVWEALGGHTESRASDARHEAEEAAGTAPDATPSAAPGPQTFPFDFDSRFEPVAKAFGVTPGRAGVEVDGERLTARFGPWTVETTRDNVTGVEITGPYAWWKVIGPAHVSLRDRGLTFATNARRGLCIRFRDPVPGIEPTGRVRHPGLTVTVADPEGLSRALGS